MTGPTSSGSTEPTHAPLVERGVVIVTFAQAQILDVTGPLEVFSSAARFLPSARYRTDVVTTTGGPVLAGCGLTFSSTSIADVDPPVDTLVVAGGEDMTA